MEKIEKELKFKITDPSLIIKNLLDNGAVILNQSKEKTIRFDTPNLDLEKKGVFIRVREGSKKTITLKEKIGDNYDFKARKETEFQIEDIDNMKYILEKIGLTYIRIFEKYRINLSYKNTVISIDELPFGLFLEIEGEDNDLITVVNDLKLDINQKILGTYWDIFEEYKKTNTTNTDINILFPVNYKSILGIVS